MLREYDNHGRDQINIETLQGNLQIGGTVQQRVSVIGLGLDKIAPEHKPHEWIERTEPQRELLARLQTQRLIELVAVGGFGKSLLAAWLFHTVKGEFERSLWLNFRKVPTFNEFMRWVLQEIGFPIDDPRVTDDDLGDQLAYRLTERRCLLVLDQLEAVQNGNDRASFEQFLQTWHQRGRSSIVIVTTRSTFGISSEERFTLARLTDTEGAEFLTKQNLSAITEQGFERLTQLANGHPLLLRLAASWVRQEAQGCLTEADLGFFQRLFSQYQGDSEAKVEEIFAVLFAKLPERLRSLLLGVVVYRDPFGLEMAQAMLEDATIEDLQTLSDRAFLRQEAERWTLHPLMGGLVERELKKSNRFRESHERAIAYFIERVKPEPKTIEDCAEELEIFHHCCELSEYALAEQVISATYNFLCRCGYYSVLILGYEQLLEAWEIENSQNPEGQFSLGSAWTELSNLYVCVGQHYSALSAIENAQKYFKAIDNSVGKAACLANKGGIYYYLGKNSQAISFYRQSLEISLSITNNYHARNALSGLGSVYENLKNYNLAESFHSQALLINQSLNDRDAEATIINNLGNVHHALGQYSQAIDFYQQSLDITRELGHRRSEAIALENLAGTYNLLEQYSSAIDFGQGALEISREIGDRASEAQILFKQALILAKFQPRRFEALNALQQARAIYTEINLDHKVEQCDEAIREFNQIIATEQRQTAPVIPSAPAIGNPRPKDDWYDRSLPTPRQPSTPANSSNRNVILWFCVGIAIVLLIAWIRS